jgi:hypothetical protein
MKFNLYISNMKKILIIILISVSLYVKSQKIDFNNFNSEIATKVLAETFLNFRDTIDCYRSGQKWSENHPEILLYPELTKPRWSEWVYKTISLPNCKDMVSNPTTISYHIDRSKWYEDNSKLIRKEFYKSYKDIPKILYESSFIDYVENVYTFYNCKLETYQELAERTIKNWDGSIRHSCAIRGLSHDVVAYEKYKLKIRTMFACCVLYSKETKITRICLNFIE